MTFSCWKKDQGPERPPADSSSPTKFDPQPSPLSIKYCKSNILPDDNDVWIEGRYQSSTTGESIPYFRSLRTGKCFKVEPPTGARKIVRLAEVHLQCRAIQAVAKQRLTKDHIRGMPEPSSNPEVVEASLLLHQPPRKAWRSMVMRG
eukprot:scaffold2632_cov158-Amphora_coffeaeformis.AAC.5